jgi:hypothetical protein
MAYGVEGNGTVALQVLAVGVVAACRDGGKGVGVVVMRIATIAKMSKLGKLES